MTIRAAIFTLTTALVVSLLGFFHYSPFAIDGVETSSGSCDESDRIETITESSWNGAVLALTITEAENCAFALQSAVVQRIGSHLFVRTSFDSPSALATACHCRHSTTLRIPGVPRRTYQIHTYSWP